MIRFLFLAAFIVPLVFSLCTGCQSAAPGTEANADYVLVILKTGPNAAEKSPEERNQIQAAHLANIGRLAEAGKLLIAGPFDKGGHDSTERGIFVFDIATLGEARELTETDPAVQAGVLRLEAHSMRATPSLREMRRLIHEQQEAVRREGRTPSMADGIRKYEMVTVKDMDAAAPALAMLESRGKIAWSGRFSGEREGWGVFIVDAQDPHEIEQMLGGDTTRLGECWIDPWWSSTLLMELDPARSRVTRRS